MSQPLPKPDEPSLIERPNELIQKTGGKLEPRLEVAATAAEKEVNRDIPKALHELAEALDAVRDFLPAENREALRIALELKSLGAGGGYPLLSRVTHSLVRILTDSRAAADPPKPLIDAHIDAARAILKNNVTGDHRPVGLALATELEKQSEAWATLA